MKQNEFLARQIQVRLANEWIKSMVESKKEADFQKLMEISYDMDGVILRHYNEHVGGKINNQIELFDNLSLEEVEGNGKHI